MGDKNLTFLFTKSRLVEELEHRMNGSGHNRTIEIEERLGELRDVGKNEAQGEDSRSRRVNKMDSEANCSEGETGNLERGGLGEGELGLTKLWFWMGNDLRW